MFDRYEENSSVVLTNQGQKGYSVSQKFIIEAIERYFNY